MSKHVLFVCKSCQYPTTQKQEKGLSDGTHLLNQLLALYQDSSRQSELKIQALDCLWACDRPCVVALSGTNKLTYLFTDLPLSETAAALLEFGELYLDSNDGNIPYSKFPEAFKSKEGGFARIPPVPQG